MPGWASGHDREIPASACSAAENVTGSAGPIELTQRLDRPGLGQAVRPDGGCCGERVRGAAASFSSSPRSSSGAMILPRLLAAYPFIRTTRAWPAALTRSSSRWMPRPDQRQPCDERGAGCWKPGAATAAPGFRQSRSCQLNSRHALLTTSRIACHGTLHANSRGFRILTGWWLGLRASYWGWPGWVGRAVTRRCRPPRGSRIPSRWPRTGRLSIPW
jgi:hypothetical protein